MTTFRPDEELQAAAHWLTSVEAKLPMSTFKTLAVKKIHSSVAIVLTNVPFYDFSSS